MRLFISACSLPVCFNLVIIYSFRKCLIETPKKSRINLSLAGKLMLINEVTCQWQGKS